MSTGGQALPTGPQREVGNPACPLLSPTDTTKDSSVGQQLFSSLESFRKDPETKTDGRSIHEKQQSPAGWGQGRYIEISLKKSNNGNQSAL